MSPAIGRSWCTAGRLQPCRVWIDNGSYRKSTLNASHCGLRAHFSTSNTRRRVQQRDVDLPFLDAKWQEKWESWKEKGIDRNFKNADGEKKYILPMFPYPSGDLHLGHLRVYTIADVLARYNAMQGYRVMHPIGWDAFGLPAENAAIERGIDPAVWTKQNIAKMRTQLKSMNGDWDWDREFATCDPSYYKHTQRIFLLLHERGLAYQAESLVNYDPVDKTVLANEQVDDNGCSWRSGAKVEQRLLKQWFLKISHFRQPLLDDLKQLKNLWPERVLTMQKHWLGRSMGTKVKFAVSAPTTQGHENIEVFTTRPNTLFGVQYIALAASHPIVVELAKTNTELQKFLDAMPTLPLDSKAGYLLPDLYALNPLANEPSTPEATKAPLPIYVAPYVLSDYGDGAVMGVPGHDLRDYAFWKQNRGEDPIRSVIRPPQNKFRRMVKGGPYVLNVGELTSECGPFAGLTAGIGNLQIIEKLQSKGVGHTVEKWRLRDWLISRQRYWGAPIPIIHCDTCGPVRVPVEDLPVELPNVEGHWLKGKAGNPLEDADDWINTPCPKCGSAAKRDTDTMDTFVDSSWYFTRFPDPHNASSPVSPDAANWALPVDLYVGGVEHAILHLLYARFISKFLATTCLWPDGSSPGVNGEPFKQLLTQGMVHGKTYSDPGNGRFLKPHEVDLENPSQPVVIATGEIANVSYEKMSKSKYNGVDPTETMAKYGADATRAHILFQAPVTEVLDWDEGKISGVTRWLRRLMTYIIDKEATRLDHAAISSASEGAFDSITHFSPSTSPEDPASPEESQSLETKLEAERILWRLVQQTIISVTDSYSNTHSLNTVVSDLMTLTNAIINPISPVTINQDLQLAALTTLIKMMAPITPAFAEECWLHLNPQLQSSSGERLSIFQERFPIPDGTLKFLGPKTQKCAVQVNGKLSVVVEIPIPPSAMDPEAMGRWVTSKILATKEGWEKLGGATKGRFDIRNAKKAFVIKEGRTVNYIL